MILYWRKFLISLLITLGTGGLAGLLTRSSTQNYATMIRPAIAPPAIVFPIVWTILYILMGISLYIIWVTPAAKADKQNAYIAFGIQLFLNFMWSIIFFNFQAYLFAFIWLIVLWLAIVYMIFRFEPISKTAAYLQIPYLLWVTFAGFLNYQIFMLNR